METSVRSAILKAAETQFVKFGIRAVSVDDICNEIHISKKTFYTEFAQKEELINEVYLHILSTHHDAGKEVLQNSSLNVIDRMFQYRTPSKQELKRKYERFQYELVKYYPEIVKAHFDAEADHAGVALKAVLEEGKASGFFREDLNVAVMTQFLRHWQLNACRFLDSLYGDTGRDEAVEVIMDGVIRMVASDKGLTYYKEKYQKK